MKMIFVRRRGLGHSSTKGLVQELHDLGITASIWRNDQRIPQELTQDETVAVRWGCSSTLPLSTRGVLNKASGIHSVNDKMGFLKTLDESPLQKGLLPVLTTAHTPLEIPPVEKWVVRPRHHSQGRNLHVVTSENVMGSLMRMEHGYARPLVQKKAEYRVYVVDGRVVNVARKTPGNPDDVAWNVAQGGRFDNVRWGDWPINVVDLACSVFPYTGLNFSGIDVMVDENDEAWFIEANSAPSLPFNSDGSTTYRHKCMAKALAYSVLENKGMLEYQQGEGYRGYIHPALGV